MGGSTFFASLASATESSTIQVHSGAPSCRVGAPINHLVNSHLHSKGALSAPLFGVSLLDETVARCSSRLSVSGHATRAASTTARGSLTHSAMLNCHGERPVRKGLFCEKSPFFWLNGNKYVSLPQIHYIYGTGRKEKTWIRRWRTDV